jgi:hypothetical protein
MQEFEYILENVAMDEEGTPTTKTLREGWMCTIPSR